MSKRQPTALAIFGLALGATLFGGTASAVIITPGQSVGSVPASPGTGLSATYYKFSQPITTLAQGDALVAAAPGPTAGFNALTVCFPSCNASASDTGTLASYIATNGTNLTANSALGQAVSRYNGFIAIPTAAAFTFNLLSDDGSSLAIGGTSIINNDGVHGLQGSSASVTFQSAGLYSFYVDHFENAGSTGVTLLENNAAIVTSSLYSAALVPIPEPASLVLLSACLAAVTATRRHYASRAARPSS